MANACPLAFRQIDENIARINIFFVTLALVLFLVTSRPEWMYFLCIDYLTRLYGNKQYSLLNRSSVFIQNVMRFPVKMADAGAKRLASQFGLLFVMMIIVSFHLQLESAMIGITAVFLLCTAMDLLFRFCVGCKIYYLIKKIYPSF